MKNWVYVAVVMLVAIGVLSTGMKQRQPVHGILATDVSWPNCDAARPTTSEGIVGVTGGLDFRPNPCLRTEATWFPVVSTYMNTGWPGSDSQRVYLNYPWACTAHDPTCLAYNYGYHAAVYAMSYANQQLVHTSQWWLDVETENSWTADKNQNRAALIGMIAAIKAFAPSTQIGFYSYPGQWQQIVGNWRPRYPAWVATGSVQQLDAVTACRATSFTAGPVILAQYTKVLDLSYYC